MLILILNILNLINIFLFKFHPLLVLITLIYHYALGFVNDFALNSVMYLTPGIINHLIFPNVFLLRCSLRCITLNIGPNPIDYFLRMLYHELSELI